MNRSLVAAFLFLVLASCSGITDPIERSGFRVENRTADTLVVWVTALTPTTDVFISPVNDTAPPARIDSVRINFAIGNDGPGMRIVPQGASLAFLPAAIAGYAQPYDLAVLTMRLRKGYLIQSNGFYVRQEEVRSIGPQITLRDGKFFPNVLR
jgi:hypothetical protein